MPNLKIILLLLFLTNITNAQLNNSGDPRLGIDFWLKHYKQVTRTEKYELAKEVFDNVLAVADKPTGVLPELYVFSNLEFGKVFALPDGSVILPLSVIDFCLRDRRHTKAQLAFLLGHEIKHVVRGDYWIQRILEFAQTTTKGQQNDQIQTLLTQMQWGQSLEVRKSIETDADEYGILYASLAGYDVGSIISPSNSFISDYYRTAGMDIHGDLTNNSVDDRIKAVNRRLGDIVDDLDLFDFGVRLYAIGKYDAAIELLRKFVTQYPSREVFNNLGICYYQKAFAYYAKWKYQERDKDPNLVFRVSAQIDPISRLQVTRATKTDKQLFLEMIDKAIANFEEAKARDASYEVALNNLGCACK
jgi:tetratricopeptide (TPR) repeat protein